MLVTQKVADDCVYPWDQNIVEITLYCAISEINAFLHFTNKFMMASKNEGGKQFFAKKIADDSVYHMGQKFR